MEPKTIAAEGGHWYHLDGRPCYEVPKAKGEGTRPTTLADARKLNLVPSVTTILQCAAKPGLEACKTKQLLEAALTLPQRENESLDDYATRVIEDSKAQGLKARDRGTELHAAIENYIRGNLTTYQMLCLKVDDCLAQHAIPLRSGNAEKSFTSELGYGGKIDYSHNTGILIDFKTKDRLDPKLKCYDEHLMQCAAYGRGVFMGTFRALNVFVGIDDCEVRVFEHSEEDLQGGGR